MIIQVDKAGRDVISQLCDIALKQGGVSNLNQVNLIFRLVTVLSDPEVVEHSHPKSPEKEEKAEDQAAPEKQDGQTKEKGKEDKESPKEETPKEVVEKKPEVVEEG